MSRRAALSRRCILRSKASGSAGGDTDMIDSKARLVQSIVALSALAFAACGGHGVTPPFASQVTHQSALVASVVDAAVPNVAGTYDGTFTVTESGHLANGT